MSSQHFPSGATGPLGVAINGLGGFAWVHHWIIQDAERNGLVRLLGYCDHQGPSHTAELRARYALASRAREFPDLATLLDGLGDRCGLVTLPSPPTVHASDHALAVERRIPCYLEKPPTLDPRELGRMILLDKLARIPTVVGFNQMADRGRLRLKERMLQGELGALISAHFAGLWPRAQSYYTRSAWPGRLKLGEQLVLDSIFGNAMAHYAHNLLFWAGTGSAWSWARVASVRAELYRANAIESTDTVFAQAVTTEGVRLSFAMSHAAHDPMEPCESLEFSRCRATYSAAGAVIEWNDGRVERLAGETRDLHQVCLENAFRRCRGERPDLPAVALTDCASFVDLNALLYVGAGGIHSVPAHYLEEREGVLAIAGLPAAMQTFGTTGRFPSEQSVPWASARGFSGTEARAGEENRLREAVDRLAVTV